MIYVWRHRATKSIYLVEAPPDARALNLLNSSGEVIAREPKWVDPSFEPIGFQRWANDHLVVQETALVDPLKLHESVIEMVEAMGFTRPGRLNQRLAVLKAEYNG